MGQNLIRQTETRMEIVPDKTQFFSFSSGTTHFFFQLLFLNADSIWHGGG